MFTCVFQDEWYILIIVTVLIIWHRDACVFPCSASGSMSLGLTCGVLPPDVSSWHYWGHMLHFHPCGVCVCTHALALSISTSVFFFPRYCFCLFISSLLFLASYSFPLLSFWFCHTALLHIYEYFLNKQCRSAFKYQDQCCCCIKENCLAQLPAALCHNSPLGEAERKSAL